MLTLVFTILMKLKISRECSFGSYVHYMQAFLFEKSQKVFNCFKPNENNEAFSLGE